MPRRAKRAKKRLEARIASWELIKENLDAKNKKNPISGFAMRKPGSMSK